MALVTKKRRTDNRKISAIEVASDSVPENFSIDEVEDKADGSEMESSGEDDIETPNSNQKERKQRKRKGADGGVSEKEKAQAVSDMYEYKSNVFRMETEELLKEVRLNYQKRMAPVERVLHRLKSIIEAIPENLDIPVSFIIQTFPRRKVLLTMQPADMRGRERDEQAQNQHSLPGSKTGKGCYVQIFICNAILYQHRWRICA